MTCLQYTIRGVPDYIDDCLRDFAKKEEKSLNQVVLDLLASGLGKLAKPPKNDELVALAGTWIEDPEANRAFEEMRTIDEDMWK